MRVITGVVCSILLFPSPSKEVSTLRADGAIAGAVAIQSNGKIVGRLFMTLLEVTSKRAESLPSFKK